MDYKKLYTPSEATAIYNVSKIRFDPSSYSLKGNLILGYAEPAMAMQHISSFNYDTERILAGRICAVEPRPCFEPFTGIHRKSSHVNPLFSSMSIMYVQQDNLHICLETLGKFYDLTKIKTGNVLQAIVTMCVALNSTKSCAKDLMWLSFSETQKESYDRLHNFAILKEELSKLDSVMHLITDDTNIDITYVPSFDTRATRMSDVFQERETISKNSLFSLFAAAFEVMWALKNIPIELRNSILALYTRTYEATKYTMELFEPFITHTPEGLQINTELTNAINISNPKERYEAYAQIIVPNAKDIYRKCESWFNIEIPKKHFINPIMAAFIGFANQLSVTSIRINYIRILYEYCKTKGYLNKEDTSEIAKSITAMGALSFDTSPDTTKPLSKSLMDIDTEATAYVDAEECDSDEDYKGDDDSALFEALDKLKSSFSAGRYSFEVKDVTDCDDESLKTTYNSIASKVELVNKLLIRRIRDIKTYNVGGKNPGKSSGKLDRKALYRYKYDPNIFYNNTYKTIENDLAFGIILDESGSMSGKGIENGRITMIVLHETLKALGINHSIIGHTSHGRHHSQIARYQSFREDKTYSTRKNYAIVNTKAKAGNCDSGALYFMEKALDRVKNKDKICLIFSDGEPTECTGSELKQQVRTMERKGIKVIGIGINFENIAKYYTDYANGRNLSDMLNIVAKILEEYVLKKKDI